MGVKTIPTTDSGPGSDAAKKAAKEKAARDRAAKKKAKAKRDAKKKKKCDKKLRKDRKDELRGKSPSPEDRARMNNNSPQICPACRKMVTNVAADHVVPFSKVVRMPGFACLSKKNQLKMVNHPTNFRPLCGSCNSSKCAKLWKDWKGKGGSFGKGARKETYENLTKKLLSDLPKEINKLR